MKKYLLYIKVTNPKNVAFFSFGKKLALAFYARVKPLTSIVQIK